MNAFNDVSVDETRSVRFFLVLFTFMRRHWSQFRLKHMYGRARSHVVTSMFCFSINFFLFVSMPRVSTDCLSFLTHYRQLVHTRRHTIRDVQWRWRDADRLALTPDPIFRWYLLARFDSCARCPTGLWTQPTWACSQREPAECPIPDFEQVSFRKRSRIVE